MTTRDPSAIDRDLIKKAMSVPLLTPEEERSLGIRIQESNGNDKIAIESLVKPHIRLVISIANKFRNYGLPLDDLLQEGILGLLHAAERYDPKRQVRFATYAQWWIRSCMTEHVLRNWSLIRLGTTRTQKFLFFNLRRLRNSIDGIGAEGLSGETIISIANKLQVPVTEVQWMEQRLNTRDSSINASVSEEGPEERGIFLIAEGPDPERYAAEHQTDQLRQKLLEKALDQLTPREREIIAMRRLRDQPMTLEQVGAHFNVSKERIRQLEHRAMNHIKQYFKTNGIDIKDLLQ